MIRNRLNSVLRGATSTAAIATGLIFVATNAGATPAVFFNDDLVAGEQTFVDTAAAADAAYNAANPGATQDSVIFRLDLTNSTGNQFSVTDPVSAITVYVRTALAGSPANNSTTGDEGGDGFTNWGVDYTPGDFDSVVSAGYNISFFSDASYTTPYMMNAVGLHVSDWGTCCAANNTTPTGTENASQIYMQFDGSSPLLVGGISTPIMGEEHFIAAIDDRNAFSSVTMVPNGSGEAFGAGGVLIFSTLQLNSVPEGSSVVTIGDATDITGDVEYSPTEVNDGAVNPKFDGGTLGVNEDGTITADITVTDAGGTIDTLGNDVILSGDVTDDGGASGGLTKAGEGVLTLTGENSYSGGTIVSQGTLKGDTVSLQGDIENNATLEFSSADDGTFTGDVSGSGTLVKSGSGTLILTGDQDYTGETFITEGTLALQGSGSIAGSGKLNNNGTFDISGTTDGASLYDLGGTGAVDLGGKDLTVTNGNGSFDGTIGGTGGVTLSGGRLRLTGVNGFTGDTVIDDGSTLALSGEGSIAGSGHVISNGTFDISGTDDGASVRDLAGNGSVALGGKDLTVTNGNGSFDGTIGGTGGVTLSGGTLTLTGANGFTGDTIIDNGSTLALSGEGSIAGSGRVVSNGTFDISGTDDGASVRDLAGNGSVALGSKDLTLTDANGSFDGSIGGTGSVNVSGGALALNGNNSFSGGLVIDHAIVGAGTSGALGTGNVTINSGTLAATRNFAAGHDVVLHGSNAAVHTNGHDVTLSGVISGDGTLNKLGTGTLTLTGQNSQNGINVKGGTLAFNSDAALGAPDGIVTIEENTTLKTLADFTISHDLNVNNTQLAAFDTNGHDIVMAGDIGGAGVVQKIGSGTLTLTGNNSQVLIDVLGGRLIASSQGSVGADGGDIYLRQDSSFTAGSDMTLTQNVHVVGGNATFDTGANNVTLTGAMDGTQCLIKAGSGRLTLAAAASNDIGACVEEGTLSFNNRFDGQVWVYEGGTAGGSGLINGNVQVNGTLAPGNSPGQLVVAGSVTQMEGSRLALDIDGLTPGNGAGHYDTLVLTGANSVYTADGTIAPTLRGITGSANNDFTPKIGQTFQAVTAEGGVQGTFDALEQPSAGLATNSRFDVFYTANNVVLAVTADSYGALLDEVAPRNAANVGHAIDAVRTDAGVFDNSANGRLLQGLMGLTSDQVAVAAEQVSGEIHADIMDAVVQTNRTTRASVSQHLEDRFDDTQGTGRNDLSVQRRLWMNMTGNFGHVDKDVHGQRYEFDTRGVVVGLDGAVTDNLVLGAGFAYGHAKVNTRFLGTAKASSYQAIGYGSWQKGGSYLNGIVSAGIDTYKVERDVALRTGTEGLSSKSDGFSWAADLEVGHRFQIAGAVLTPSIGLAFDRIERERFSEDGDDSVALIFGSAVRNAPIGRIGLRLSKYVKAGKALLTPYATLSVSHELSDKSSELSAELGNAAFRVAAPVAGPTAVRAGAGISAALSSNISLRAGYRYTAFENATNHSVNGGLSIRW